MKVLIDIVEIIRVPHKTQELVSAEKTPTLSIALPAYEFLVLNWQQLQHDMPSFAPFIQKGIDKVTHYVLKSRQTKVYALAISMCAFSFSILNLI